MMLSDVIGTAHGTLHWSFFVHVSIILNCNRNLCGGSAVCILWHSIAFRLRLVGYSDWNRQDVHIYLDPTTFAKAQLDVTTLERLRRALADHVSALVSHVFLGYKPARPSQSRWTGVAHVCQWALGLALFHRILKPLLSALSTNASTSENSADPASRSMDVDVCD